uniref:Peptidase C1A papain C-terminal domain-containing protein n=1 Tax=Panagrolaimus davidi TaxID=227884 RepID=A0A914QGD2_9BILA
MHFLSLYLIFSTVLATAAASTSFNKFRITGVNFADPEIQQFTSLIDKHKFNLGNAAEFLQRLGHFREAKQKLKEFHGKFKGAKFTLNQFSLMSEEEQKHYLGGLPIPSNSSLFRQKRSVFDGRNDTLIPANEDFRSNGYVSPVKNQGSCGSCYAFAAAAAIESQYLIRQNKLLLDLSEQTIVNCESKSYQCKGGFLSRALDYAKDVGIPLETCSPYTAQNGSCNSNCNSQRFKISGYYWFDHNEAAYAQQLHNFGPFTMWLTCPQAFMSYSSGILDLPAAECSKQNIGGHFLLVVGYTPDYWIAKNSWGPNWGENGYVRFKRGQNFCDMTRQVITPYL